MNARQKAKKLKKQIGILKSDNDLMREIIADSPAMQELYDLYNKPKFVTHTTMQFQEYRSRVFLDSDILDDTGLIEILKQEITDNLLEGIKKNITYEVDTECMPPQITASIFVGKKE
jgi:hypothetical protein